jgi:predicted DNA-binding transcriptional regulator AlpA
MNKRILTDTEVAVILGKSKSWLCNNYPMLEQIGFPKRDPVLKGRDIEAVNAWIDSRFNRKSSQSSEVQRALEAISGQNYA